MSTRYIINVSVALAICVIAYGQDPHQRPNRPSKGLDSESSPAIFNGGSDRPMEGLRRLSGSNLTTEMIRNLVKAGPLKLSVPRIQRMGDAAASTIAKLFPAAEKLTEQEQLAVIDIVQHAYTKPNAIVRFHDRAPTMTMALLDSISGTAQSMIVVGRIGDAKQSIHNNLALLCSHD
jgi:hypothetical protein